MDEILNNNEIENEEIKNVEESSFEETIEEPSFEENETSENEVFNPVTVSKPKPIKNYKPMSVGLKVFSIIMAGIIMLTAACSVGYFVGRSSIKFAERKTEELDLKARPKDAEQMSEAEIYNKTGQSVVGIMVYNSSGKGSQASGIVYSENGYIITNDHIYSEIPSAKFKIYTHDGKEYNAKYIAGDKVSDLAVLKVDNAKLNPATFGNSDDLYYGEHVVAIGRPRNANEDSSITSGIISGLNRRVQTTSSYSSRVIQTDSAINPGSSGGALVNMYGQVIGVTSSKMASVDYEGVGYAIPTTVMKRIVTELIEEGKVISRAKLGITYKAIDSVLAEINGSKYTGLLIDSVTEESGLYGKVNQGDIITHINGIAVTNDSIVLDIIESCKAGDKVNITVVDTAQKTKTFNVVLLANVSESSYTITDVLPEISGEAEESEKNGGKFNFPFGE